MKFKYILVFLVFIIVLAIIAFPMFSNISLTGQTIRNEFTFTKAICDDSNFCQDYQIHCKNGKVISETPISGSEKQYPESWEDPRTEEQVNRKCE